MEALTVLAEIEYSKTLRNATVTEAGVWRYVLRYAEREILPFMDSIPAGKPDIVSNVVINQREYIRCDSFEHLRRLGETQGGWYKDGGIVHIRFPLYEPPCLYYSHRYGIMLGFTNGGPAAINGIEYRPGLLSAPLIEHCSDAFTYDAMKFNSAGISIENTRGQFDNVENLFGNECNLFIAVPGEPNCSIPLDPPG